MRCPLTTNDFISLEFLDTQDHVAGAWTAETGAKDWPIAFELYQEVSKQVLKWDKVLDDVEAFIGQS